MAWIALNSMSTVRKSHISDSLKRNFFHATVESVLLYNYEAWSLTSVLERSLNGCYTQMLRAVLNFKGWHHIPNTDLYVIRAKIGDKFAARSLSLVGHCINQLAAAEKVLLWEPIHGHRRGRKQDTFLDTLRKDAALKSTGKLRTCMED